MGKQFKKLQKKIYKADEELFWDSILDFFKKENLYVAENTILWKRAKKSTIKQLRKSVREDRPKESGIGYQAPADRRRGRASYRRICGGVYL